MDWITIVSEFVLPVLGLIFTVFIVPIIREKKQTDLAQSCVAAAEQIFGAGHGTDKYTWAQDLLVSKGVSRKDAQRLIEAAVYQLNAAKKALEALETPQETQEGGK